MYNNTHWNWVTHSSLHGWLQVVSGGQQGGVCIWEVHQQKLLARQRIDTGPSPISESCKCAASNVLSFAGAIHTQTVDAFGASGSC